VSEICLIEMEWLVVVEDRAQVTAMVVCRGAHRGCTSYLGA